MVRQFDLLAVLHPLDNVGLCVIEPRRLLHLPRMEQLRIHLRSARVVGVQLAQFQDLIGVFCLHWDVGDVSAPERKNVQFLRNALLL